MAGKLNMVAEGGPPLCYHYEKLGHIEKNCKVLDDLSRQRVRPEKQTTGACRRADNRQNKEERLKQANRKRDRGVTSP